MKLLASILAVTACIASAAAFDESAATTMAIYAGAAYCSPTALQNWKRGTAASSAPVSSGTVHTAFDSSLNVFAYVAKTPSGPLVSFRGTEPSSLKDWIDDLDAKKTTPYKYCSTCEVHQGFYNSYMALQSQIVAGLNSIGASASAGSSVSITGHSLGAAMAALCAWDLHHAGFRVNTMYTFGEPRVGNTDFYTAFKAALPGMNRVTHYKDIVPHLPMEIMGFHHVATEVWFNEDNTSHQVCDGSGEDPTCSDSVIGDSINDHLYYMGMHISGLCTADQAVAAPALRGSAQ